ncbi:hypothetical protein D3C85_667420 [compost metagenome]
MFRPHPRFFHALHAHLVLHAAQGAVGVGGACRQFGGDQTGFARQSQQGDVAQVFHEHGVRCRIAQHQILRHEFHVDHAATVMLQVKLLGGVGMAGVDFFAHGQHLVPQRGGVAGLHQNRFADLLEAGAHLGVARGVAGARQRLVFPGPGMLVLILLEGLDGNGQQTGVAVWPQAQIHFVQAARRGHGGQPGRHAAAELGVDLGGIFARIVEQEHQVQVGRIAQFLAAQLAVGDDGKARRGAVHLVHQRPGAVDGLGQQQVCKRRQLVRQLFHRELAFQILRQQLEAGLPLHVAHQVHLPLDVGGAIRQAASVQVGAELARDLGEVQRFEQRAPVDQAVQQQRMLRQVLRGPGAGGHHPRHARQRVGVFGKQRQISAALDNFFDQVKQAHGGIQRRRRLPSRAQGGRQQRFHAAAAALGQAAYPMAAQQRFGTPQQVLGFVAKGLPDLLGKFALAARLVGVIGRFGGRACVFRVAHADHAEDVAEGLRHELAVRGQRAFKVVRAHAQRGGQRGALRGVARQ